MVHYMRGDKYPPRVVVQGTVTVIALFRTPVFEKYSYVRGIVTKRGIVTIRGIVTKRGIAYHVHGRCIC